VSASRPSGRCAVALRASLDPDALIGAPNHRAEETEERTDPRIRHTPPVLTSPSATDKQGSRPVRWAAVESVQRLPATTRLGAFRDALAAKRGHNIAVVAAARRQLEYVFYALRDHHVSADLRSPTPHRPTRPRTPVPTPSPGPQDLDP